jgi:sigma-B regulation protein RsbU (phosphoserine phosphatase)
LNQAYNEVLCTRLSRLHGDRRGLAVHASAPLRAADITLGILNVAAPEWSSFSPQALGLLTNVGSQIGTALDRARLYDLLREQRGHEQESLLTLSQQLLSHLDLDELISHLVEEVQTILHADACALLLRSEAPGFLEFRASRGWHDDPGLQRRRVPADERSGPGLVLRQHQPLLAEDLLRSDPTPWAPDWVQAEGFRGHAVVPLLRDGQSLGVLVINQRQPRLLEGDEVRWLRLMASQAALAIEKARLHEEEIRMQAMEKELAVGQQIQLSLLPETVPVVAGWEFAAHYQAAREVGGDFYDFYDLPTKPDRLGLVIADVTGKGVPAALFMARTSAMVRGASLGQLSPAEALGRANELIITDLHSELLLTALYAELDIRTGRMTYANAGHYWPLWLHAETGEVEPLSLPGIILGAIPGIALKEETVTLAPGDTVVLYTDGVTDAMTGRLEALGEKRLQAVVAANRGASATEMAEAIVQAVQAHVGGTPQYDDLTLVVVRRSPVPPV